MTPALLVEILRLVNNIGVEAAIIVMEKLGKATTIDEAITALRESRSLGWTDFKRTDSPVPPAPTPAP